MVDAERNRKKIFPAINNRKYPQFFLNFADIIKIDEISTEY